MIIDAHAHLDSSAVSGLNVTAEDLFSAMDTAGIETSIVQPFPFPGKPVEAIHDAIADLAQKHPGRIYGLASINPHQDPEAYHREASRCVKDLGFVALKLHPMGHLAPINAASSDIAFETAFDLGVPLMIHTGFGVPFTLPALAIPRARQYPDLTLVLAHAGEALYASEALVAAQECAHVYLETSWSQAGGIQKFIRELGPERVMMGSDLPNNVQVEMAKYNSIDISEAERQLCLGGTAAQVFGLPTP